jgi:hypothetical protein
MVAGLVVFGVNYHHYLLRKEPVARNWLIISSGFTVICLGIIVYQLLFAPSIADKNLYLLRYAAAKLGGYLAAGTDNGIALIITDAVTGPETPRGKALLEGLKAGFGKKINIQAVEVLGLGLSGGDERYNPRGNYHSPSFKEYDETLKKYPLCNVIVFLAGLPPGFIEMDFWRLPTMPKTVIINIAADKMRDAIKIGLVTAVLSFKPGEISKLNDKHATSENLEACFELITK